MHSSQLLIPQNWQKSISELFSKMWSRQLTQATVRISLRLGPFKKKMGSLSLISNSCLPTLIIFSRPFIESILAYSFARCCKISASFSSNKFFKSSGISIASPPSFVLFSAITSWPLLYYVYSVWWYPPPIVETAVYMRRDEVLVFEEVSILNWLPLLREGILLLKRDSTELHSFSCFLKH